MAIAATTYGKDLELCDIVRLVSMFVVKRELMLWDVVEEEDVRVCC